MQYDDFVGCVQQRARIDSQEEAVRAIYATLETLGERLGGNTPNHLAAQLPPVLGHYFEVPDTTERFSLDEFFRRVAEREQVDLSIANHHARAVISVLAEAISPGELADALGQLPEEFRELFKAEKEI